MRMIHTGLRAYDDMVTPADDISAALDSHDICSETLRVPHLSSLLLASSTG